MTTITVHDVHIDSVIVAESCCVCGVVFGLGKEFASRRREIAAGVCPCCHRSFVGLQQHIARQHPTFVEESEHA